MNFIWSTCISFFHYLLAKRILIENNSIHAKLL
jgi:hypothetical protein